MSYEDLSSDSDFLLNPDLPPRNDISDNCTGTIFGVKEEALGVLGIAEYISDKNKFSNMDLGEFKEFLEYFIDFRVEIKAKASNGEIVGGEVLSSFNNELEEQLKQTENRVYLDDFMERIDSMGDEYGKALIDNILSSLLSDFNGNMRLTINVPRRLMGYAAEKIKEISMESIVIIEALETSGHFGELEEDFHYKVEEIYKKYGVRVDLDDVLSGVWGEENVLNLCRYKIDIGNEQKNLIEAIKIDKKFIWEMFFGILEKNQALKNNYTTKHYKWGTFQKSILKVSPIFTEKAKKFGAFINTIQKEGVDIYIEGIEYSQMVDSLKIIIGNDDWMYQGYMLNPKGDKTSIKDLIFYKEEEIKKINEIKDTLFYELNNFSINNIDKNLENLRKEADLDLNKNIHLIINKNFIEKINDFKDNFDDLIYFFKSLLSIGINLEFDGVTKESHILILNLLIGEGNWDFNTLY